MPIVPNREPGSVLTGVFDRRQGAALKPEFDAFQARLAELMAQKGFQAFIPLVKEEGPLVRVVILPASLEADGATTAAGLAGTLGKLGDQYRGTGRFKAGEAEAKVAGYEGASSGGFLEDPDFAG